MVTVGSILGGTFGFARDNLRVIAIWSVLTFLLSLLSMVGMQPFYAAQAAGLESGTPVTPNFGVLGITLLVSIIFFTVLLAAMFRAVLFPSESRFAYLRIGMDELRLFGTMMVILVGVYLLFIILGVILTIAGLMLTRLSGASGSVALVLGAGLFALMVWLTVRLSLAGPLTILERKIVIGPAWRLSRGAFWRLFLAYLAIAVILMVSYAVIIAVQMGPVLGDMFRPLDPAAHQRVVAWQAANYGFSARSLMVALVGGILGGIVFALQAGMLGVATAQLLNRGGQEHLNTVFE